MFRKMLSVMSVLALFFTTFLDAADISEKKNEPQNTEAASSASTKKKANKLVVDALEIIPRVESICRKKFPSNVKIKGITRDDVSRIMLAELDHDVSADEFLYRTESLKLLGFVSDQFDLKKTMVALLKSQVAGFYMPRHKTLYLIDGVPLQQMITAHELSHAIQDKYYDLQKMMNKLKADDDGNSALTALLEGQAMFVMGQYSNRHMKPGDLFKGTLESAFSQQGLGGAPDFLVQNLIFPYVHGQKFYMKSFENYGWGNMWKLYKDIPASSEQVLHYDKYYKNRDKPTIIGLDRKTLALEDDEKILYQNNLGELNCSLLLSSLGLEQAKAAKAARGWDGDRFALLGDKKVTKRLFWLSTWDSEGHAFRFSTNLQKAMDKKYGANTRQSKGRRHVWTVDKNRKILLSYWRQEVVLLNGYEQENDGALLGAVSNALKTNSIYIEDNRKDGVVEVE